MERLDMPVPPALSHITREAYNDLLWLGHCNSRKQIRLMAKMFDRMTEAEAKVVRDDIAQTTRDMTLAIRNTGIATMDQMLAFAADLMVYKIADPEKILEPSQATALLASGSVSKLIRGECD